MRKFLFIFFFITLLIGLNTCKTTDQKLAPYAQKGLIDLRQWDFQNDGNIDLTGEWEFYWNKLYSYKDFAHQNTVQADYVKIGDLWNSFFSNNHPRQGFATYRLKILLNDTSSFFSIFLKEAPFSAGRIFINDELIGNNGKVANNTETYKPSFYLNIKPFKGDSVLHLIVQVSNYEHNRSGGILFHPVFGNAYNISYLQQKYYIINLLLLGGIIVVMLYHFVLFLQWKSQKSNLYFFLFSFFIFLYLSSLFFLHYFISDFQLIRQIRMTGWFLAVPVYAFLSNSIFNINNSIKFIGIFIFISILLLILYFLKIEYIIYIYDIVTVITSLYVILIPVRNFAEKKFDAKIFFIGILFVSITGINDALNYMEIIHTTDLLPLGVFILLLTQSYILLNRFADAYKINRDLSDKLINANKNLEKIVLERTKKIEEQNIRLAELNATKDRFFGIVAHNLRGPVGNWSSSLALLIDTYERLDSDTKLDLIKSIKSSTDKTFHLLENLLIWSRIQRRIINYSPRNILFQEIIDENVELLMPSAKMKNISILFDTDKNLMVYCDVYMMDNVLRNILSNAIKFTPEHGIVEIVTQKNSEKLELIIKDNGIGMDKTTLNKLFKIEHNILSKGTKGETGSGLGLIISKEFIDKHKGSIYIESEIGKGTIVKIKIPQDKRLL